VLCYWLNVLLHTCPPNDPTTATTPCSNNKLLVASCYTDIFFVVFVVVFYLDPSRTHGLRSLSASSLLPSPVSATASTPSLCFQHGDDNNNNNNNGVRRLGPSEDSRSSNERPATLTRPTPWKGRHPKQQHQPSSSLQGSVATRPRRQRRRGGQRPQ
jgi:hypothetical protein